MAPFSVQLRFKFLKAVKCALQVFYDLICKLFRRRKIVQISKRLILDPKNVEARFVPLHDLVNRKLAEPTFGIIIGICLDAIIAVFGIIASDEIF